MRSTLLQSVQRDIGRKQSTPLEFAYTVAVQRRRIPFHILQYSY